MPRETRQSRSAEEFPISGHGRQRLLDAALELFDQKGLDATSARAVAQRAGHRNVGAVGYHFGDMRGLLCAVLQRQQEVLDARRHELLDALEATGDVTPHKAIDAMFTPHVELLTTLEGRRFLRVLNQTANHPTWYPEAAPEVWTSNQRGVLHLFPIWGHLDPDVQVQRALMAFGLCSFALAERARLIDTESPPRALVRGPEGRTTWVARCPRCSDRNAESVITGTEESIRAQCPTCGAIVEVRDSGIYPASSPTTPPPKE